MILSDTHSSSRNYGVQAPLKTKSCWVWLSPKPAVLGGMDISQNKLENRTFLCLCCRVCSESSAVREGDGADSSDMIKINILSSQWGDSDEELHSWTCPDPVPSDSHSDFRLLQTASCSLIPTQISPDQPINLPLLIGIHQGQISLILYPVRDEEP